MAHPRKSIRQAVIQRLKDAETPCGERVFGSRKKEIQDKEIPCMLVITPDEPASIDVESPREYERKLEVHIEIILAVEENVDDELDDLCELVEKAIFQEETFGGLVKDCILVDTNYAILDDGDRMIAGAKIILAMPYNTALPDGPAEELDPFEEAHISIDLAAADGAHEVEADVDLPQ